MRLHSVRLIVFALAACVAAGCGTPGTRRDSGYRFARNHDVRDRQPFHVDDRPRGDATGRQRQIDSPELRQLKRELAELPPGERRKYLELLEGPVPPGDEVVRAIRAQLSRRRASTADLRDDRQLAAGESARRNGNGRESREPDADRTRGPQPRFPDGGNGRPDGRRDAFARNDRDERGRNPYRDAAYDEGPGSRRNARFPLQRRRGGDSGTALPDNNVARDAGFQREPGGGDAGGGRLDEPTRLSTDWNDALRKLIALTEARANEKSKSGKTGDNAVRNEVYLRLLHLMSDNPARAATVIRNADGTEQQFWRDLVWGMFEYLHQKPEFTRSNRAARTIASLRKAMEHLRADADLEVRNLEFCRKIRSYGNYDVVKRDERTGRVQFRPGEQVLMYAEIENFKTERDSNGHHKTRLRSTIELYYAAGEGRREFVKRFSFRPTEDLCRRYRRDYFHSYIIELPSDLKLGNYVLKLTVEDIVGDRTKVGSDTVQFEVR